MCGICGVWNYRTHQPVDRDVLRRMTEMIQHRGPDDSGVYADDAVGLGLGFRRLSIIDLSPAGHQPMCNEDGNIWVVFNGEIYNYQDLRPNLESHGHVFRSRTDTEVIIHSYETYGSACVEQMNGMFGLAIWDAGKQQLVLARDRMGKKPVYYYDDGNRLLFASELKAILTDPSVLRELDWTALGEYFALGYVPGSRSILKGVHKLLPGHTLTFHDGRATLRRYWDWLPAFRQIDAQRSQQEWIAALRELLTDSVRRRMISDVPLGAFLSGGVDSSAVVATMAGISSQPVKTFSIGFTEPRYNELAYARQVAQRFQAEHHEMIVEPESIQDLLPLLARQYDEPFADSSALPTYYVSKMAREHVTVCLSGDGGDEACAGYSRYAQMLQEALIDRVPQTLRLTALAPIAMLPPGTPGRRFARRLMIDQDRRYGIMMRMNAPDDLERMLTLDAYRRIGNDGVSAILANTRHAKGLDLLSRVQYADGVVYLPDDILVKVDRASMLNSLEVRSPLLDYRFLELMAAVPPAMRIVHGEGKHLFKQALRGIIPDSVLDRPKMGFGVPLEIWFRDDLAGFARQILLDPRTLQRGIFSREGVEWLVRSQSAGSSQFSQQIWNALMFEHWCRIYLDAA